MKNTHKGCHGQKNQTKMYVHSSIYIKAISLHNKQYENEFLCTDQKASYAGKHYTRWTFRGEH